MKKEIVTENKIIKTAWDKVTTVRMKERPQATQYINLIFDDFIELHGDRAYGDDPATIGGIAYLNERPVTIIAQQRGRSVKENIERNFGMPLPEGYRKSLRLMKQAEKFGRPVICFVDTKGAHCGIEAEERGQGEAIARNLMEMAGLKTPIISIVLGEGGSGGALALCVADKILMLEHAIFSVLSPEGFASILWKDSSRAHEAAEIMKITAQDLKGYKIIDEIIEEPYGGAHKDIHKISKLIKSSIITALSCIDKFEIEELLKRRYEKFRAIGEFKNN
jgi:acetyl-CoA carboxylase carboxyl transferase alpha subunit